MVAEEVFMNCYGTVLILLLKSKKVINFQSRVSKTIRSRISDLRLRGAGADRNFFCCTTLIPTICYREMKSSSMAQFLSAGPHAIGRRYSGFSTNQNARLCLILRFSLSYRSFVNIPTHVFKC